MATSWRSAAAAGGSPAAPSDSRARHASATARRTAPRASPPRPGGSASGPVQQSHLVGEPVSCCARCSRSPAASRRASGGGRSRSNGRPSASARPRSNVRTASANCPAASCRCAVGPGQARPAAAGRAVRPRPAEQRPPPPGRAAAPPRGAEPCPAGAGATCATARQAAVRDAERAAGRSGAAAGRRPGAARRGSGPPARAARHVATTSDRPTLTCGFTAHERRRVRRSIGSRPPSASYSIAPSAYTSARPSTAPSTGRALPQRPQRGLLLGRHVGGVPPKLSGSGAAGADRLAGEVEVEQHRLAVGGQQDVGRLEVQVDEAALVGELQRVGQARRRPSTSPARTTRWPSICRARRRRRGQGQTATEALAASCARRSPRRRAARSAAPAARPPAPRAATPASPGRSTACTGRGRLPGRRRRRPSRAGRCWCAGGGRATGARAAVERRDLQDDRPVGQRRLGRQEDAAARPRASSASSRKSPRRSPAAGKRGAVAVRLEQRGGGSRASPAAGRPTAGSAGGGPARRRSSPAAWRRQYSS